MEVKAQPQHVAHIVNDVSGQVNHHLHNSMFGKAYALPDLHQDQQLAELILGCRQASTGYPLTYVEDPWLHITIVIKRFWQFLLVKFVVGASGT